MPVSRDKRCGSTVRGKPLVPENISTRAPPGRGQRPSGVRMPNQRSLTWSKCAFGL
ncbi:hypothetical protein MTDSW087_03302 [Methylobacterium dankookense]|uniref:Uncharacterized protein n=1 Tax=Methylobacterium dankookense TaxID=560405 RepID=A0A564FZL2_9HYPH|nr:hypothetical protein IFDJLNFL_1298 [Methylobacterium dankookense]VUF13595.1 hypothetical protein MTDSW087_03302 [Methylobacterium dankookense]